MNAMATDHYDLVVLGGGPAGAAGAITAAAEGHRVVVIEREPHLGGAGINTGTVPSKTLRETALTLNGIRARRLTGLDLSLKRQATIDDFVSHQRQVTDNERARMLERADRWNVDVVQGDARFVDAHTVQTGDRTLSGDVILVATGSSPVRPPEFPFEDPRVHDSNEILELDHLPRRLAVVGAGVIGSEYACMFAALGTEVVVIDGRDTFLPSLDTELSASLRQAMVKSGIVFRWKELVTTCDVSRADRVVLTLSSGVTLELDGVLVAAGRVSNTETLNLAAAGLTAGPRGLIVVDDHYQTSVPHIYAAGDVIGAPALASTSLQQARGAMCHAFGMHSALSPAGMLPTGIYTIPEVSSVGETEESLRQKGIAYVVGRASYRDNARGDIIGDDSGFLKLLFRQSDMKLLGVHVIGEQATELVHVGLIGMLAGADARLFEAACYNFPTLGDLYRTAALRALSEAPS